MLTVALLTVFQAKAKIAVIPIEKSLSSASYVCVGTVHRIFREGDLRVAEITVEKTLKGQERKTVRFVAQKTWSCDSSDADLSERGIYILQPGSEAMVLAHAGSGRIVFTSGRAFLWGDSKSGFGVNAYNLPSNLESFTLNGRPFTTETALTRSIVTILRQRS